MPGLSRFAVRVSLVYLGLGLTLGALILANLGVPFAPLIWTLLPAHIEFMFFGWMTQFALGIAFWILPRFPGSHPRGDERWSQASFALLNGGVLIFAGAALLGADGLTLLGRSLEATALAAFVIGNWRRVYSLRAG